MCPLEHKFRKVVIFKKVECEKVPICRANPLKLSFKDAMGLFPDAKIMGSEQAGVNQQGRGESSSYQKCQLRWVDDGGFDRHKTRPCK